MKEPFLINPIGRRVSFMRKRSKNPGELLILGNSRGKKTNNSFKKRSIKMKTRKRLASTITVKGYRRKKMNPRRKKLTMAKRSIRYIRKNPIIRSRRTYRHRRHNPMIFGMDLNFLSMLTGGISAIATTVAPTVLNITTPIAKYGIQGATALGGLLVINKLFKSPSQSNAWFIVSASMIVADLIKEYILPKVSFLTNSGAIVQLPKGTPATVSAPTTQGANGTVPIQKGNMGYYLPQHRNAYTGAYLKQLPQTYPMALSNVWMNS